MNQVFSNAQITSSFLSQFKEEDCETVYYCPQSPHRDLAFGGEEGGDDTESVVQRVRGKLMRREALVDWCRNDVNRQKMVEYVSYDKRV
jgi:hypothetical protein